MSTRKHYKSQSSDDENHFPIAALGLIAGRAAVAARALSQAALDVCGNSVLAVATLATQHHADIELPTGAIVPIANFFITIANTGERKSSCDRVVLPAVQTYEQDLLVRYDQQKIDYFAAIKSWRDAEGKVRRGSSIPNAVKGRLKRLGPPPKKPLYPNVRCKDTTFPGLCTLFAGGRSSLGIFTTEAGQFLGGYALRDHSKIQTASGLCLLWDGESLSILRKAGNIELGGCRLSIHLMVQPDAAARLITDRSLAAQGLLSRFLFVAPKSEVGNRFWQKPDPYASKHLREFETRISECLRSASSFAEHDKRPRLKLKLTRRAQNEFIHYANKLERSMGPSGRFHGMIEFVNKSTEHAARIAAVLSILADPTCKVVHSKYMRRGVKLAWYYANQSLKVKDLSAALASPASTLPIATDDIVQKLRELGESDKTIILAKHKKIKFKRAYEQAAAIRRASKDGREGLSVKTRVFRSLFGAEHTRVARYLSNAGVLRPTRKSAIGHNNIKTYTRQERIPGFGKADFYVIDWKLLVELASSADGETE